MTEETPTPEPMDDDKAWARHLAFNTDAARAGLMAAAIDIADTMRANGVQQGEACLLTGAIEFACQLWMQVAMQAGRPRQEARKLFEKEARTFLNKHGNAIEAGAQKATMQ